MCVYNKKLKKINDDINYVADKKREELNELFNIDQDIKLHLFSIDDFNNIELTYQQMSALMFMIKDEE